MCHLKSAVLLTQWFGMTVLLLARFVLGINVVSADPGAPPGTAPPTPGAE